jgi:hypothetical protein
MNEHATSRDGSPAHFDQAWSGASRCLQVLPDEDHDLIRFSSQAPRRTAFSSLRARTGGSASRHAPVTLQRRSGGRGTRFRGVADRVANPASARWHLIRLGCRGPDGSRIHRSPHPSIGQQVEWARAGVGTAVSPGPGELCLLAGTRPLPPIGAESPLLTSLAIIMSIAKAEPKAGGHGEMQDLRALEGGSLWV